MPLPLSLICPRCDNVFSLKDFGPGCLLCRRDGMAVNLIPMYDVNLFSRADMVAACQHHVHGVWRYRSFLPIADDERAVSLGEGETPSWRLRRFAHGFEGELWVKDETRNVTWSHKDRAMAVAVTRGRAWEYPVLIGASSGNGGASLAAYAAAADVPCVIFTNTTLPEALRTQMLAYGAYVLSLERDEDRWSLVQQCIDAWNWYPATNFTDPPAGSNPYGIEGYKTIAYEIFADFQDRMPDYIVVPTGYGDLITGIWRGFAELQALHLLPHLPCLVIAEPANNAFYTMACAQYYHDQTIISLEKPTVAFSLNRKHGSLQALRALYATEGFCVPVPEEEIVDGQLELARCEGLYLETASIAAIVAGRQLLYERGGRVMALATASGLKDPDYTLRLATQRMGGGGLLIAPTLNDVQVALKRVYRFEF